MEKEFVSYEQALALKELGFDGDTLGWYDFDNGLLHTGCLYQTFKNDFDYALAPLKQQVFKFFRDKYNLYSIISDVEIHASKQSGYRWKWIIFKPIVDVCISSDESLLGHLTYEEAEIDCIDKLIELGKQY